MIKLIKGTARIDAPLQSGMHKGYEIYVPVTSIAFIIGGVAVLKTDCPMTYRGYPIKDITVDQYKIAELVKQDKV